MAPRSWWVMLLLIGPLVVMSFISAVRTYGELSGVNGTAAGVGEAFSPLIGVWAPTFSACELAAAFLLPFVAIRLVSGDRQSGALKLELQHPMPAMARMSAKATIAGDADRASGILFNVKQNGDWLAIRYNDTENNVGLWEFHNGIRRLVKFSSRDHKFTLDRSRWHELQLTVDQAKLKAALDGELALEYVLGSEPGPGRNGAPPNPDLFPANNPVLRPPVSGKVGLWAKTDSTSYFKDYVLVPK